MSSKISPKVQVIFILFIALGLSQGFRRQKEYCSILAKCGLETPAKDCPDSLKTGVKDVEYNQKTCKEARYLVQKGVPTTNYQGQKLFGFLGQKYRVEYKINDKLPIPIAQFEYLLGDIPLAAKVVNAFQKTKYSAKYLDGEQKKYWRGTNGRNLDGEAYLISGGVDKKDLTYFGFGIVKILKWKLKGQVLFDYTYKDGKPIPYNLTVLVFPGGAIVNAIMNMGLFKRVVKNKILEVFEDISDSAEELNEVGYEKLIKKYKWTKEEKEKLKVLLSLK